MSLPACHREEAGCWGEMAGSGHPSALRLFVWRVTGKVLEVGVRESHVHGGPGEGPQRGCTEGLPCVSAGPWQTVPSAGGSGSVPARAQAAVTGLLPPGRAQQAGPCRRARQLALESPACGFAAPLVPRSAEEGAEPQARAWPRVQAPASSALCSRWPTRLSSVQCLCLPWPGSLRGKRGHPTPQGSPAPRPHSVPRCFPQPPGRLSAQGSLCPSQQGLRARSAVCLQAGSCPL